MFYIDVTQINKLINNQRLKKHKRDKRFARNTTELRRLGQKEAINTNNSNNKYINKKRQTIKITLVD